MFLLRLISLLLSFSLLFGCAPSTNMAPVVKPGTGEHIVKRGDTLYGIAFARGMRYQDLATWNRIAAPYIIYPGQRLRLYGRRSVRKPSVNKTTATRVVRRKPTQVVVAKAPRPKSKPIPRRVSKPAAKVPAKPVKLTPKPVGNSKKTQVAATSKTRSAKGGLDWMWPTRGKLLKGFSASSEGKKGIAITGKAGQPIVSAASGKIVYAGSGLRGYGKLIIIEHNKKYLSAYAHNRVLNIKEGDRVARGQPIAEMGNTGTSRVMLHFEIRRDGQAVDPTRYLPPHDP